MDPPHRLRSVLLDNTAKQGMGLAFLLLVLSAEERLLAKHGGESSFPCSIITV